MNSVSSVAYAAVEVTDQADVHAKLLETRNHTEFKAVNKGFLTWFIIIMNLPGILLGYAMAYNNQVEMCINVKMGWLSDKDQNYYQSLLGSSVVLGMTLGAVGGGMLMRIGRRKAIMISCCIGMVGIMMTIKLNLPMLMIGRFVYGYSVGLFSSICPRYFEENIPPHIYE